MAEGDRGPRGMALASERRAPEEYGPAMQSKYHVDPAAWPGARHALFGVIVRIPPGLDGPENAATRREYLNWAAEEELRYLLACERAHAAVTEEAR